MPIRIYPKNSNWDWSLLLAIFLYQIIPSVYNSYSIYLIGNADPSESALAIASQWQTIQVILEIIQESILFPIYFFVGSKIRGSDKAELADRIASCLKIIATILIPVVILVHFQARNLVELVNTPAEIVEHTIVYLRIKIWSILFGIANLGLIIIAETVNLKSLIIRVLIFKTILFVFFDSLFFGGYEYSLGLGINGAAFSSILVEVVIFLFVILNLEKTLENKLFRNLFSFKLLNLNLFGKISIGLLIESFVRNVAYLVMIVSMLNSLGTDQVGGYYLSMHLFWSILLVPVLAVSETLKVKVGNCFDSISEIRSLLFYALRIVSLLLVGWVAIIPFASGILNYLNHNAIINSFALKSFYILFIPYGLLSINLILDSVFYGMGQTKFLAYQSIFTNFTVYLIGYVMYITGFWNPTFNSILLLFSTGIIVDSVLTIFYLKKLLNKEI